MSTSSLRRVTDALVGANAEVRFVGGCVRNSLFGNPVKDIDIATDARPEMVIDILKRAEIKTLPTGIEHGTVTAVVEGETYEITTYRKDIRTDGRHAVVEYGSSWREDAERRDFTINAMSVTLEGELFDPFGGRADLAVGRIRFVGKAESRVREDILRILRWFRFYAHFGRLHPDPEVFNACRGFAFRIRDLSGERIRYELLRMLEARNPLPSLELMIQTDVIDAVFGRGGNVSLLAGLVEVERQMALPPDPILRFAALMGGGIVIANEVKKFCFPKLDQKRIVSMFDGGLPLVPRVSNKSRRRELYRLKPQAAEDRILLSWARSPEEVSWQDWLNENSDFERPVFPLSGYDVYEVGINEGPTVGSLLKAVEEWWVERDFAPDYDACFSELLKQTGE